MPDLAIISDGKKCFSFLGSEITSEKMNLGFIKILVNFDSYFNRLISAKEQLFYRSLCPPLYSSCCWLSVIIVLYVVHVIVEHFVLVVLMFLLLLVSC